MLVKNTDSVALWSPSFVTTTAQRPGHIGHNIRETVSFLSKLFVAQNRLVSGRLLDRILQESIAFRLTEIPLNPYVPARERIAGRQRY